MAARFNNACKGETVLCGLRRFRSAPRKPAYHGVDGCLSDPARVILLLARNTKPCPKVREPV
jgi:hypothetical protein